MEGSWQVAEKHLMLRLHRSTPQRGANEGNAADDVLMVDQGLALSLTRKGESRTVRARKRGAARLSILCDIFRHPVRLALTEYPVSKAVGF
jgi:hypothetical protein